MAVQIEASLNAGWQYSFGEMRYAMKAHWATRFHYDLRLVWNDVALSWALPDGPSYRVGEVCLAIEMEDHKPSNLLFEGVHTTGPVMVCDRGSWKPDAMAGSVLASLQNGFLRFTLRGERVHGVFTLTRKSLARETRRAVWELHKEADLFGSGASSLFVLSEGSKSICTGRTKEQIVRDWNCRRGIQATLFGWG